MVLKCLRRMWRTIIVATALAAVCTAPVLAAVYGTGGYGNCVYQQGCAQPPPPTVVITPTGLEVSINLTNGQVIPLSGYTIVITPLNGKGSSFKKAEIYINGKLVKSAVPAETGTVQWRWTPGNIGKYTVKVIIYDTNNATTVHQFTVTVKRNPSATQSGSSGSSAGIAPKTGIAGVLQHISNGVHNITNGVTQAIKALPAPAIHSFPYILFVLLGIDVILLVLQTGRELREYHKLQALLTRARAVDDAKKSFTELASHYLRTPLTVIMSSIDLLSSDKKLVSSQTVDLQKTAKEMHGRIESLISQMHSGQQSVVVSSEKITPVWKQLGLFLPIVFIAGVWLIFDFLISRVGSFSVGQLNFAEQIIAFIIVATALYIAFRYRQLRRRDTEELRHIIADETAISSSRDALIADTTRVLSDELTKMESIVGHLLQSPNVKFIQEGEKRFQEVLTKFAIASRLSGLQSVNPLVSRQFDELLGGALQSVQPKADARGITIQHPQNAAVAVQEPELLMYVLSSILDNAVAYSREKSSIEVAYHVDETMADITITDHGVGVPSEKLPLLFQPFSKAEGAELFTHEGMGFSLYLDKLIMTYLDGSITLESKLGSGTVVTIHVPQAPVANSAGAWR